MPRILSRSIALSVLVPLTLTAQVAREHDPLLVRNWPAPLYWQPPATAEATAQQAAATNPPVGSTALVFVAMAPCRLVDTRQGQGFSGSFGPPSIAAGLPVRTIPVQSSTNCSVPYFAQAYSFNVTVVAPGPLIYLTLYPATFGTQPSPPNASTLNAPNGGIVANAAIVPAGTDAHGSVNVYASNATDLIIDINGYYAPPSDANGNSALGAGSLFSDTTGGNNTALGLAALQANTVGSFNTATGYAALLLNTSGSDNVASGYFALRNNTAGANNTANGALALQSNTSGNDNTAGGYAALQLNTMGSENTATGYAALNSNTTGNINTANGALALQYNTTGVQNTAMGVSALQNNTTGNANTAAGVYALNFNTTGGNNMAAGFQALGANTTGNLNAACGALALANNTIGANNTATGSSTMGNSTTGNYNTAVGSQALLSNTTGSGNIAIGYQAADSVFGVNSNNIHIGSGGTLNDNGVIRIGNSAAQNSFFAAGIRGATTGNNDAIPVVIDSNGQLGTVNSSARFKYDIRDMGDASSGLLQLHPVTFRYRQPFADGSKPVQYGLIAEEVEKVMPEMVVHSADGQVESVKYQMLDSMLLNELQKQAATIRQQTEENRRRAEEIELLKERLAALESLLPKPGRLSPERQ